jgi:transcription elongation factor GreB
MSSMPIYITPEGREKVRAEFDQLWKVERPKVTAEVEAAAALGDRSENAEHIYGQRRLREIDKRLQFLSKRLERMKVIDEHMQRQSKGRVGFGAWVAVEDEDGQPGLWRIVGPDESDPDRGHVSLESPIGRALLGKEEGDEVEVRRPKGSTWLTIMAISYGPRPVTS